LLENQVKHLSLATVALGLLASPAAASWDTMCKRDTMTDVFGCEIVNREIGLYIAFGSSEPGFPQIAIFPYDPENKVRYGMIRIDKHKAVETDSKGFFDPQILDQLRTGQRVRIRYYTSFDYASPNNKAVEREGSLDGFAAAFEAARKAQEEAKRLTPEEAARQAQDEVKRKAQEEAEQKAREEAERKVREEAIRQAQEQAAQQAEADRKALEDIVRKVQDNPQAASSDPTQAKPPEPALPNAVAPLPPPETPIFGPPPPDADIAKPQPSDDQTGVMEPPPEQPDVNASKPPAPKSKPKRQPAKSQARADPGPEPKKGSWGGMNQRADREDNGAITGATARPKQGNPFADHTRYSVCWAATAKAQLALDELKNRRLTLDDCAKILKPN
jgi:hypothetical protein